MTGLKSYNTLLFKEKKVELCLPITEGHKEGKYFLANDAF